MPSRMLPSSTKATRVTARKPPAPPGTAAIVAAIRPEKPDWVSAHAMADAVPMTNRIAPDSAAVSTKAGSTRPHCTGR